MALNGIPISPDECIGDSLTKINDAFLTLDTRVIGLSSLSRQNNICTNVQVVPTLGASFFDLIGIDSSFSTNANAYCVMYNGVIQEPTVDYTVSAGGVLATTSVLPAGTRVTIIFKQNDSGFNPTKEVFTGNGVKTNFALTYPIVNPNYCQVTIDGILQEPDDDFVIVPSTNTILFLAAPPSGSKIVIISQSPILSTSPSRYKIFGDGKTTSFFLNGTLINPTNPAVCRVFMEGVLQEPGTSYGIIGSSIWFNEAPPNGTKIVIFF